MWLINQQAQNSPVYHLPLVYRLKGTLNIPILEQAINKVIQRHEALRTFFPLHNGLPIQRILNDFSLNCIVEKLSLSLEEKVINERIKTEINQPFDLTEKPPIRYVLFQLNDNETIFLMVIHHLIADGWSLSLILQELSKIYNGLLNNTTLKLSPVSLQYKDFSTQHQQWLEKQETSDPLVDYWTQELNDAPLTTSLPIDYSRPPFPNFEGSTEEFSLNQELTQQLRHLSQESDSTLNLVLLSAFLIFVYRHNQQQDLVIGIPIANRNHTDVESVVGSFSNIIPFRILISDNYSFFDFIYLTKKIFIQNQNFHEFPVENMLQKLGKKRDFSYHPWFQIVFNFLNFSPINLELKGIKNFDFMLEKSSSLFDLMLLSWETSTEIKGIFEYNTSLYRKETITEFINQFKQLINTLVSNPRKTIKETPAFFFKNNGLSQNKKRFVNHLKNTVFNNFNLLAKRTNDYPLSFSIEPSEDIVESCLINIFENTLKIHPITLNDNFFELGGHSLLAMRLLARIEQKLKVHISLSTFFQNPTIAQIVSIIQKEQKSRSESSLVPINTKGKKKPLFFINSISQAKKLGNYLDKEQSFYIVNIFAITEFLNPQVDCLTLKNLANKLIEDIQTVQPTGPYHLVTFCADSFLTFEVAQQLKAKGQKIAFLGFIDSIWDSQNSETFLFWHNFWEFGFNYLVEKAKNRLFSIKQGWIIRLKQWQGQVFFSKNRALPRALEDARLLKAFEMARNQYSPQLYHGKVILFLSQEYRLLNPSKLENLVTEGLEIQEIPGYHHTLFKEPYISTLAEKLQMMLGGNQ